MKILEIGKEYTHQDIDFLSKRVISEQTVMYLGKHPYDQRNMFALYPSGMVHAPDGNEFINDLIPVENEFDEMFKNRMG